MPINPTYPGVYIEEVPSGVRTLTGVATSITAFIGRAQRGPVNEPVVIFSYADFERSFGGLWQESEMSYAVRDFYLNGGDQAIIVRLATQSGAPADIAMTATATLLNAGGTGPELSAADPGAWGNKLVADVEVILDEEGDPTDVFNLTVRDKGTNNEEKFLNVLVGDTNKMHPRYLPAVLKNESDLVRMSGDQSTATRPDNGTDLAFGVAGDTAGTDGVAPTENDYRGLSNPIPPEDPPVAIPKTGIYALENADLFNLMCIPNMLTHEYTSLLSDAIKYCRDRRAMLIIDGKDTWGDPDAVLTGIEPLDTSTNAAIYFPHLMQPDPLRDGQIAKRPPCGAIAGVIARTDATRGIWKAPAGLDATLNGVPKLSVPLTDDEIGRLNPKGVNCLKAMPPAGRVVWGARTRKGDDQLSSEWKYIPIRRLALYIEESLYRGTQWVVFEPNDEPLWAQIRLNLGAFMNDLFRKGAFQGSSPADAYFVKCDKETTTQSDINKGIVNIVVGFAPLKPAEFVIIKLQQIAGQLAA